MCWHFCLHSAAFSQTTSHFSYHFVSIGIKARLRTVFPHNRPKPICPLHPLSMPVEFQTPASLFCPCPGMSHVLWNRFSDSKKKADAVNDLAKSMAEHWSCVTFHHVRLGSCNTGKSTFTPGRFMFFFSPMAMSFMTWQHTLSDDISCWSPPTQLTAHQKKLGLCYHKIISTALNLQGQWSISRQNDATCTANPVELHSSQLWRFGNWQLWKAWLDSCGQLLVGHGQGGVIALTSSPVLLQGPKKDPKHQLHIFYVWYIHDM